MFRSWILALSLVALFFIPAGGFGPFAIADRVGARVVTPITETEANELAFLDCIEQTASAIPDMATVQKVIPDDAYISQRVGDILFPRIRFAESNADYSFYISTESINEELISSAQCAQYFVGVKKNA
jgi:hypothetical protein